MAVAASRPELQKTVGGRGASARGPARRRGRASPCAAARPRRPRAPGRSDSADPAHTNTSTGRSRLPPAASVDDACSAQRLAMARRDLLEQRLGARQHARRRARPRSRGQAVRGVAQLDRAGVDRDDPAGGEHPAHVGHARGGHAAAPGRAGPGSASPSSAGSRRRRGRRPRCPISGTTRSNQMRKNNDSGGFCGVVISSTTTLPPGLTTRAISRQAAGRGRRSCARRSRPSPRRTRRPGSRAPARCRVRNSIPGAFSRAISSIFSAKSTPITSAPALAQRDRQVARARRHVERASPGRLAPGRPRARASAGASRPS